MRILYALVIVALVGQLTHAQHCGTQRYQERVFPQITKHTGVVFASNVPAIVIPYVSEMITMDIDLTMDIYEPVGDSLTKRPLVILAYGGAFIFGSKEDEDVSSVCDSMAHRGYVTASINYRMGLNPVDGVSAERAVYRATQDFNAAIRYLKEFADVYGIDTSMVFIGGVSAGGFAALHNAYGVESDRPASTYSAGGLFPRPDLGCKSCVGNPYQHSGNVQGVISYWGAIGDTSWMRPGVSPPMIIFHGENDLIVPFTSGFPFTATVTLPQVFGGASMHRRLDNIGVENEFHPFPGVGHNIWGVNVLNLLTPGPTQYYEPIWQDTKNWLYRQIKPNPPVAVGRQYVCVDVPTTLEIAYPLPGYTYCWRTGEGTILGNPNNYNIQVKWDSVGTYPVVVSQVSPNLVESNPDTIWVTVQTSTGATLATGGEVCAGDSATLKVTSLVTAIHWLGSGYSSPYSNATKVLLNTTREFTVQITDTLGCTFIDTVLAETFPVSSRPQVVQSNDTLFAVNYTGQIQWHQDALTLPTNRNWIVPLQEAAFWVEQTDSFGCKQKSDTLYFTPTGITTKHIESIRLYPNPVADQLTIEAPGHWQLRLYTLQGQLVIEGHTTTNTTLNLSQLPQGVYLYQLQVGDSVVLGKLVR